MARYRCVSRKFPKRVCQYHCEVETEFWPKGCLLTADRENWEKVEKEP